ncbi:MCE family protein [Fodinicola feengrottensis]|uniref:MCE family protein n=1 Tax=Fodinicola feengrottensis TaxID=435914 RepID=UPI0013D17C0D|nr:MlaD family protein [Fodinicola feengrottensis]
MITLRTKIQVAVFVLVALLGVSFVSANYVGLGDTLFNRTYVVSADFSRAGGIFQNAAVTYRGFQVGKVLQVSLIPGGVRATMQLTRDTKIPSSSRAVVTDRSAVGEQYIDLRPATGAGPFLVDNTIPMSRTGTPLPLEDILLNLDKLVGSVNQQDLSVVIDELGKAFNGEAGQNLDRLLDNTTALVNDAQIYLPQTLQLIADGRIVLSTQEASASDIRQWASSLAGLSGQLKASDPDLRQLLAVTPGAATEVTNLVRQLQPNLGFLLANLLTTNQVAVRRLDGIEQILIAYPIALAGGSTVVPGDNTVHFGLVLNVDDPPPCRYTASAPLTCTSTDKKYGSEVRGWQNAPRPGGVDPTAQPPDPTTDSAAAGYDPTTGIATTSDGSPYVLGGTGGQAALLGDQAWKSLLITPLSG